MCIRDSFRGQGADYGGPKGLVLGRLGPFLVPSSGCLGPSLSVFGRSWAALEPSWGCLGSSWGRLGASWGRLGGQDPTEAFAIRVLEASWGRFGLIFGRFLDGFFMEFSIPFFSYPTRGQHVVKPKKYYFCNTGEPFEALHVEYF